MLELEHTCNNPDCQNDCRACDQEAEADWDAKVAREEEEALYACPRCGGRMACPDDNMCDLCAGEDEYY